MKKKASNAKATKIPKNVNSQAGKNPLVAAYLSVLAIVFIFAILMSFSSKQILLSPGERSTLSYEDARLLLHELGSDGIAWYCGEQEIYADKSGNKYGEMELDALREILGNRAALEKEFCS